MKYNDDIILTSENFKEVISNMRTSKSLFLNSECMFVEYHDIIKCPWYILLSLISQNQKIKPILDLTEIEYLDSNGLFEWYCNRKNRNFLQDLAIDKNNPEEFDKILSVLMNNEIFYSIDTKLNAVNSIKIAIKQRMVKNVIIYSEEENEYIRDDIKHIFGNISNIKYRHGDFREVLKDIPIDTTYMLSDFNKIIIMAEENRLNYASLVLPYDFSYNFIINDKDERVSIIDLTYLGKDHLFKYAFFNACYL